MRPRKVFPSIFLSCVFLFLIVPCLQAAKTSKQETLAKYEKAITLAEEMHIYQEDVFHILPKIKLANRALLKNNFEQADRVLDEALSDFDALEAARSKDLKVNFRVEWLEVYWDVFQHYAVLALLAFLFVTRVFFKDMLKKNQLTISGQMLLTGLIIFLGCLFSIFDLSRYGESTWAFFDAQLVLLVAGGLLGGVWVGLFSSAGAMTFRLILKPEWDLSVVLILGAGLLAGLCNRMIKNYQTTGKISFTCGFLIGILHGLAVYLPMQPYLPLMYLVFSVAFLAVLEAAGVMLIMGVISGVLREENRRDIQNELMKTRLLFLQAQLKPHFFFNALNTISAICSRENATQAQGLIFRLADFLRHTLKREDEAVTLREEMAFIDDYLEIEKARFQDRLQIHKEFHLNEKTFETKIPLLILQPLVENAIGHGIRKKEQGGNLWILANDKDGALQVEIIDDGAGAEPDFFERLLKGEGASVEGLGIGVRNIHQRLARFFKGEAKMHFSTLPGEGTRVTVKIPIR